MYSRSLALLFVVACVPTEGTDTLDPTGGGKADNTEGGIARDWRVGGTASWYGWGPDRKTVVGVLGSQELVWDVPSGRLIEQRASGDARCDAWAPAGYGVRCRADGLDIIDSAAPNGAHVALHQVDDVFFGGDRIAAVWVPASAGTSTVSIIDRTSRTRVQTIDMHGTVRLVEFLPGNRVLVLQFGGLADIYRIEDGVRVATLKGASASPDGTVIAAADGLYDITTLTRGTQMYWYPPTNLSYAAAWAADSQSFAFVPEYQTGADYNSTYVFTRLGAAVRQEHRPAGYLHDGAASDGTRLTTSSGTAWLSPDRALGTGSFVAAGKQAVVAAETSGTLHVYDSDGTVRAASQHFSPSDQVVRVASDASGTHVAVLRDQHEYAQQHHYAIFTYDIIDGALVGRGAIYATDGANDVVWSPDGTRVAVATPGNIRIYEGGTGRFQREFATPNENVRSVAWRSDGNVVAGSMQSGHVVGFDVMNGGKVIDLNVERVLTSLAFSADGAWLAGRTEIYDELRAVRTDGSDSVTGPKILAAAWSPTGTLLALTSKDGTLAIWDLATRTNVAARSASQAPCTQVQWPEQDAIIVGCDDRTIGSYRRDP